MRSHPTGRSRVLGLYLKAKAVAWAAIGLVLWWAAMRAPETWEESSLRLFAYFLLVFATPGVLIWTLGVLVKHRQRRGWLAAVAYLSVLVALKVAGGMADLPEQVWYWASRRFAPAYLTGLKAFGVASAVVLAADLAALLAFFSRKGRECFGVTARERRDGATEG